MLPTADTPPRAARLEARIAPELYALLKRAAAIQGRSLSDFVVAVASEAARKAVEEGEIIRLSAEDQQRFAAALLDPPEPTPALRRAAARHRALIQGP